MKNKQNVTRRSFFKTTASGAVGAMVLPTILPNHLFGKNAPSNLLQIGQIGYGRIAMSHDVSETIKHTDKCRFVSVADVDTNRMNDGKNRMEKFYKDKLGKTSSVATYQDYREMLEAQDLDAVVISTPDHWHAQPAIEAALKGKHVYLQKPTSLTVTEGRQLSNVVQRTGIKFQLGSQQRSDSPWPQFRKACELVRNGRIGKLTNIEVGLPGDPSGPEADPMPIPKNLNYDMWLGSTPYTPYTEIGVHPHEGYSRPGWLRIEQYGAGMITGWGVHHLDIAHWGMGTEYTGPVDITGSASFPTSGLWNVHGKYDVVANYENGVRLHIGGDNPNGVKFIGEEGWIFVSRGSVKVTSSDPGAPGKKLKALDSNIPSVLTSEIKEDEIHLHSSPEQHLNWLEGILHDEAPISNAEIAHRSCSICLISHIAMKLNRKLQWDAVRERFVNDDQANAMLSREQRSPYGTDRLLKMFTGIR